MKMYERILYIKNTQLRKKIIICIGCYKPNLVPFGIRNTLH